jgi:NAD(P)-dependent dehydrogenase (short-subunit alcohol dehydrogenase family)
LDFSEMKLRDKRVVITGASRGLGRALAHRFADEGAQLALCARSFDELNRVALDLRLRGTPCLAVVCDVADESQVLDFAKQVLAHYGSIDVLINNAAILGPRLAIQEWTKATWERVLEVNVTGVFSVTRAFLPAMVSQGAGSIINVSSSVGKIGKRHWGAYSTSKFALEGLTQILADEMRNSGVRVNSVDPGAMDTEMRHSAYPNEDRSRLASPAAVADVFVYLASDNSREITGQCLIAQEFLKSIKDTK